MERDIGKIQKNDTTDIIVRVDDFGGRIGVTIREFVTSDRYTGFTKAGVRIGADDFGKFKEMLNSIDENELKSAQSETTAQPKEKSSAPKSSGNDELPDY